MPRKTVLLVANFKRTSEGADFDFEWNAVEQLPANTVLGRAEVQAPVHFDRSVPREVRERLAAAVLKMTWEASLNPSSAPQAPLTNQSAPVGSAANPVVRVRGGNL